MKLVLLTALLLTSIPAFANLEILSLENQVDQNMQIKEIKGSLMDDLKELWDQGELPTKEDIIGWNSGRCFYATAPNTASNHLLTGTERSIERNAGPLFPGDKEFKIIAIISWYEGADKFDSMSELETEAINKLIQDSWSKMTEAAEIDGYYASTNVPGKLSYQVKKSGSYLVTRMQKTEDLGDYAYCYTYISL